MWNTKCRSSRSEVFLGKGVLKIWSKFTGEHPYRSAISIKLLWRSAISIKLLCRTAFPRNTSGWLLLEMSKTIMILRICFIFLVFNRNRRHHFSFKFDITVRCYTTYSCFESYGYSLLFEMFTSFSRLILLVLLFDRLEKFRYIEEILV